MTDSQPPAGWSDPTGPPHSQPPASAEPPTAPGQVPYEQHTAQQPAYPHTDFAQPSYQAGYAQAGYPQAGYGQTVAQPGYVVYAAPTNGLAIASMIVSILGFGPVGAIMGHIARRQIQERGEQGDGFALAGIIVGWVTTGFWLLCCVGYALVVAGAIGSAGFGSL